MATFRPEQPPQKLEPSTAAGTHREHHSFRGRPWTLSTEDLPASFLDDQQCLLQSLVPEAGRGYTKISVLDDDLSYLETQYQPSRNLAILSRMNYEEPRLVVTLALTGHSRFAGQQGDDIVFSKGHTTVVAFSSTRGERQYSPDTPVTQLRFALGQSWLERYFGEREWLEKPNRSGHHILSHRPTSTQALICAQQLLSSSVHQALLPAFRHGQALLILAHELTPLIARGSSEDAAVSTREVALAEAARDILLDEFKDPPSVVQLARRVGTNPIRLTRLFHRCFSKTPYGVLFEIRMQRAYVLLESRRLPIEMVADLVGYKHASSFSAAFSKHFGVSPKHIAKKG